MLRILNSFSARLSVSVSTQLLQRFLTKPTAVCRFLVSRPVSFGYKASSRLDVLKPKAVHVASRRWCSNSRETGILDDTEALSLDLDGSDSAAADLNDDVDALAPILAESTKEDAFFDLSAKYNSMDKVTMIIQFPIVHYMISFIVTVAGVLQRKRPRNGHPTSRKMHSRFVGAIQE